MHLIAPTGRHLPRLGSGIHAHGPLGRPGRRGDGHGLHQAGLHAFRAALQGQAQLRGHFHGALVTVFGILLHGHHAHMADSLGHVGGNGLDGRGLGVQVLHGHGHGAVPVKGHAAGEHFIEYHAAAVNIAAGVRGLAGGLLRAEIMHRAHDAVPPGQGGAVRHPGNAEVRHLHVAVGVDQDVLRLDVPVNNAVLVGVLQGRENADGHLGGHLGIQPALFLDQLLEGFALDVFHDQVTVLPVHAHVQEVDDVVVGHFAGGLGLPLEAAHKLRVLVEFRAEDLHGHVVPRAHVNGPVHNGHAAHADLLHQAVAVGKDFFAHCAPS